MCIPLLVLLLPFIKVCRRINVGWCVWWNIVINHAWRCGRGEPDVTQKNVLSCNASSTHKGRPQSTGPCHWVLHKHRHNHRIHHITQTSHINHGYRSLPVVPLVSNCKINSEATEGPKSTAPPHTNIAPLFLLCFYGIASIAFQVGTTVVFVILWQLWSLTRRQ